MIKVKVSSRHGMICGYQIEGHASSRVCSAVSALSINTANSLSILGGVDYIKEPDNLDGFMSFEVRNFGKQEVSILMLSLNIGLRDISNEYPDQVDLSYIEVGDNT